MINLADADRLEAWKALDKSLSQLESGENVYFYLLNLEGTLIPIHPLGPQAADDKTWPQGVATVFDKAMKASSHARPVQVGAEEQVKRTFKALEDIANKLAVFPGRRDILWIANGLTTVADPKLTGCTGDWVECALYVPHLGVTLTNDGVAVNPFAFIGALNPDVNYNMDQMALLTGGHFYSREDIRAVLKQVAQSAVTVIRSLTTRGRTIGTTSGTVSTSPASAKASRCRSGSGTTRCRIRDRHWKERKPS